MAQTNEAKRFTLKDYNAMLPTDIAKQYEVIKWTGGSVQYFGSNRKVDLSRLTINHANYLVSIKKMKKKTSNSASNSSNNK